MHIDSTGFPTPTGAEEKRRASENMMYVMYWQHNKDEPMFNATSFYGILGQSVKRSGKGGTSWVGRCTIRALPVPLSSLAVFRCNTTTVPHRVLTSNVRLSVGEQGHKLYQ